MSSTSCSTQVDTLSQIEIFQLVIDDDSVAIDSTQMTGVQLNQAVQLTRIQNTYTGDQIALSGGSCVKV